MQRRKSTPLRVNKAQSLGQAKASLLSFNLHNHCSKKSGLLLTPFYNSRIIKLFFRKEQDSKYFRLCSLQDLCSNYSTLPFWQKSSCRQYIQHALFCPSSCPSIHLFIQLSTYSLIYPTIQPTIHPSIHLSICPTISSWILYIHPSIYTCNEHSLTIYHMSEPLDIKTNEFPPTPSPGSSGHTGCQKAPGTCECFPCTGPLNIFQSLYSLPPTTPSSSPTPPALCLATAVILLISASDTERPS